MKTILFDAYCKFGRMDSGETQVLVELTDEEFQQIRDMIEEHDGEADDDTLCDELNDIYLKIYDVVNKQITDELVEAGYYFNDDETPDASEKYEIGFRLDVDDFIEDTDEDDE